MPIIALPEQDGNISGHFGHSRHFAFVTMEDGKVTAQEVLPTPAMRDRHQEFPQWFQSKGKTVAEEQLDHVKRSVYRVKKDSEEKVRSRVLFCCIQEGTLLVWRESVLGMLSDSRRFNHTYSMANCGVKER